MSAQRFFSSLNTREDLSETGLSQYVVGQKIVIRAPQVSLTFSVLAGCEVLYRFLRHYTTTAKRVYDRSDSITLRAASGAFILFVKALPFYARSSLVLKALQIVSSLVSRRMLGAILPLPQDTQGFFSDTMRDKLNRAMAVDDMDLGEVMTPVNYGENPARSPDPCTDTMPPQLHDTMDDEGEATSDRNDVTKRFSDYMSSKKSTQYKKAQALKFSDASEHQSGDEDDASDDNSLDDATAANYKYTKCEEELLLHHENLQSLPVTSLKSNKTKVRTSELLKPEVRSWLDRSLGTAGFDLEPTNKGGNYHMISAAMRAAGRAKIKAEVGAGYRVLVVGCNAASELGQGYVGLAPTLDPKDGPRVHANRSHEFVSGINGVKVEVMYSSLSEVKVQFDVMVLVHSCYDIPLQHVLFHAYRLRVERVFNLVMANASLVDESVTCGVLPAHFMRWTKFTTPFARNGNVSPQRFIEFKHMFESSVNYVHKHDVVVDHITRRRVHMTNTDVFVASEISEQPDTLLICWTLQRSAVQWDPGSLHSVTLQNQQSASIRLVTAIDPNWWNNCLFGIRKFPVILAPAYIVDRSRNTAARLTMPEYGDVEHSTRIVDLNDQHERYHPLFAEFLERCSDVTPMMAALTLAAVASKTAVSAVKRFNESEESPTTLLGFPMFLARTIIRSVLPDSNDSDFIRKLVEDKIPETKTVWVKPMSLIEMTQQIRFQARNPYLGSPLAAIYTDNVMRAFGDPVKPMTEFLLGEPTSWIDSRITVTSRIAPVKGPFGDETHSHNKCFLSALLANDSNGAGLQFKTILAEYTFIVLVVNEAKTVTFALDTTLDTEVDVENVAIIRWDWANERSSFYRIVNVTGLLSTFYTRHEIVRTECTSLLELKRLAQVTSRSVPSGKCFYRMLPGFNINTVAKDFDTMDVCHSNWVRDLGCLFNAVIVTETHAHKRSWATNDRPIFMVVVNQHIFEMKAGADLSSFPARNLILWNRNLGIDLSLQPYVSFDDSISLFEECRQLIVSYLTGISTPKLFLTPKRRKSPRFSVRCTTSVVSGQSDPWLVESGYCYLAFVPTALQIVAKPILGAYPFLSRVLRFLQSHDAGDFNRVSCTITVKIDKSTNSKWLHAESAAQESPNTRIWLSDLLRRHGDIQIGGLSSMELKQTRINNDDLRQKLHSALEKTTCPRLSSVLEAGLYSAEVERRVCARLALVDFDKVQETYLRAGADLHVYDAIRHKWLTPKPASEQSWAFSDKGFVQVEETASGKFTSDFRIRYLIFSEDIGFLKDSQVVQFIRNNLEQLIEFDWNSIRLMLRRGPPGNGKTYYVRKNHKPGFHNIASFTRAGRDEFATEFPRHSKRIRTYDSILLNGIAPSSLLWADEATMAHAGYILLAGWISEAATILALGDPLQIPFLSRCTGFSLEHHRLLPMVDEAFSENKTRRLNEATCEFLRPFYPDIESCNPEQGTLTKINMVSLYELRGYRDYTMLTITKDEKSTVKSVFPDKRVLTVHEAEGATYLDVMLIRIRIQHVPTFDSVPHLIVATSRHKRNFVYATVDLSDTLSQWLSGTPPEYLSEVATNSRLVPTELPICQAPQQVKKLKIIRERPNDSSFFEWVKASCGWYETTTPIDDWRTEYIVATPKDTHNEMKYDHAEAQLFCDHIFKRIDLDWQHGQFERLPFPLPPELSFDPVKLAVAHATTHQIDKVSAVLRTPMEPVRKGNIGQIVQALMKRNANVPHVAELRPIGLVQSAIHKFMETYIDSDKYNEVMANEDPMSVIDLEDWFFRRKGDQKLSMEGLERREGNLNTYPTHLKPYIKPTLTGKASVEFASGQTLTVMQPYGTVKFAGMMIAFTRRLSRSLKSIWKINNKLTAEERSGHWSHIMTNVSSAYFLEVDFSKFDKSQEEIILQITMGIMRKFGVPEKFITEWIQCHTFNKLMVSEIGLKLWVAYQRRSGDVGTFIFNTLCAMVALSFTHDFSNAHGGIFGGDDSIVALKHDADLLDHTGNISKLFNLTAKIENYPWAWQFSSQMLIFHEGHWHFVPDPLKALVRMGREDLICKEHVELYWISFADNYRPFLNLGVRVAASKSLMLRHSPVSRNPITFELAFAISNYIACIVRDKGHFVKAYYAPHHIWSRKMPTTAREAVTAEAAIQKGDGPEDYDLYFT